MSVDSRPQLASKNVCNSKTANAILFLNPYELKLEVCSLLWGCTEENYKQKNLTYLLSKNVWTKLLVRVLIVLGINCCHTG